jgi:predicted dehydrogenase
VTRVLMVGAGGVARRHLSVLSGLGVEVAGVVDPVAPVAAAVAEEWSSRAFEDVDPALDATSPDLVYICVPPFAHGPPERAVLARGLPFFVEKPLSADVAVAEELATEVEAAGVVTGTGYHWRCLDLVQRAGALLESNPPLLANGYWLGKRPPVAWWADVERSGGQVVEQVTHVLDLARVLIGEPVEVFATGAVRSGRPEDGPTSTVDDATAAVVRFETGAVATFAATSMLEVQHRASLDLFGAGLVLELGENSLVVDDGRSRRAHEPSEDPRVAVDREFLEAVRGERPATRAPYGEALRTHRLGCAIALSAREGRPVQVDPATGCPR